MVLQHVRTAPQMGAWCLYPDFLLKDCLLMSVVHYLQPGYRACNFECFLPKFLEEGYIPIVLSPGAISLLFVWEFLFPFSYLLI